MTPKKWWHFLILFIISGGLAAIALAAMAVSLIYPTLPSLESITDYKPKQPLRVYSADGHFIAEFGEEHRNFIKIEHIPQRLKDAVLAIEDRRFHQHRGVDIKGILRAIKNNLSGKSQEGASTITMQVAKNFFSGPNRKRKITTKIKESLLAIKIEKALSKDKILELYLNQIYLGQRAYGFEAASQVYFGKPLTELTLAESALLAGLPQAPSGYNPFKRSKKAINRQHEVLRDMARYGFINEQQFKTAMSQKLEFKSASKNRRRGLAADYVAELARQILYRRYGNDIYRSGLKVYTTINKKNQLAANKAVTENIINYQLRRGYKKTAGFVNLSMLSQHTLESKIQSSLKSYPAYQGFIPAIVTTVTPKQVTVFTKNSAQKTIKGKGLRLIAKYLKLKNIKNRKVHPGSIVYIVKIKDDWTIIELPTVESAFVALNPKTGAINALVGGFDFNKNQFNHVTQAKRQAGSSFKPFVYSAALEKGFTPASIIEDEEITIMSRVNGSQKEWAPKNYNGQFDGPVRLRTGLVKSKNIVSIQILDQIGAKYTQNYVTKFGFSRKDHPPYLTMALGAGEVTPLGLANAYAVFANNGYRIEPHIISKITDSNDRLIEQKKYPLAGDDAPRIINKRNVFIMTSMMQDVVQSGTATRARVLRRKDIAGKTGTTNNTKDAWFAGYSPYEVAVSWMGYDQPKSLGRVETGSRAALPTWISYMATTLKDMPIKNLPTPQGVISVKIDPITGALAYDYEEGIIEYFYQENPPPFPVPDMFDATSPSSAPNDLLRNPLQNAPFSSNAIPKNNHVKRPAANTKIKKTKDVDQKNTWPNKKIQKRQTSSEKAANILGGSQP